MRHASTVMRDGYCVLRVPWSVLLPSPLVGEGPGVRGTYDA